MYCYCSINLGTNKIPSVYAIGLFLINTTILIVTVTLTVKIKKKENIIRNLGFTLDQSMMGIESIAFMNVILWSINAVVNLIDYFEGFENKLNQKLGIK